MASKHRRGALVMITHVPLTAVFLLVTSAAAVCVFSAGEYVPADVLANDKLLIIIALCRVDIMLFHGSFLHAKTLCGLPR